MEEKYFAASNSGRGFVSYFDSVFSPSRFEKVYIIKGGPGTGKSYFMKSAANAAEKAGKNIVVIASGDLCEGKTLFSIPEQQYLDFILNKSAYSDGLDLRNKYSHGTTSTNEAKHHENYLEFLKIMVLIIIKINEEFCLKFPK